jgi:hypothetical protein
MKRLLLLFLFSGSLDGFSQESKTLEYPPKPVETLLYKRTDFRIDTVYPLPSDTLRAIVLVTMFPNGTAHSRVGFVVIEAGCKPVYLDCNKKALKLPQVGWGYEVVGGKE